MIPLAQTKEKLYVLHKKYSNEVMSVESVMLLLSKLLHCCSLTLMVKKLSKVLVYMGLYLYLRAHIEKGPTPPPHMGPISTFQVGINDFLQLGSQCVHTFWVAQFNKCKMSEVKLFQVIF